MSKYKELFETRYMKENQSYKEKADYLFMIGAPEEYDVEDEMLEYLINNSNATIDDVYNYFDKIAPYGLAPNDDGSDLLDDN